MIHLRGVYSLRTERDGNWTHDGVRSVSVENNDLTWWFIHFVLFTNGNMIKYDIFKIWSMHKMRYIYLSIHFNKIEDTTLTF